MSLVEQVRTFGSLIDIQGKGYPAMSNPPPDAPSP